MTELLYYEDKNKGIFTGKVISCDKTDRGYKILLDRTAFFPEQGGQHCDKGTIEGLPVSYVSYEKGEVCHYVPGELEPGREVSCNVDMERRFDFMQNHSGEHIISGILHNKYGFNNVGFHLSETEMTLDTDGVLTEEMTEETELEANEVIWKNLPVTVICPKPGETVPEYRSKKEIDGDLRLVRIGDVDICACCALHVSHTGEIGQIKIIRAVRYKGGTRLTVCCGRRAYKDGKERFKQTEKCGELLSVPSLEIFEAVEDLSDKNGRLKYELVSERKNIIREKVLREIKDHNGGYFVSESPYKDRDIMLEGALASSEAYDGPVFIYSGRDDIGYDFVLISKGEDPDQIKKQLISCLSAKCGGKGNMLSGKLSCTEKDIAEFFRDLRR